MPHMVIKKSASGNGEGGVSLLLNFSTRLLKYYKIHTCTCKL